MQTFLSVSGALPLCELGKVELLPSRSCVLSLRPLLRDKSVLGSREALPANH